MSISLYKERHGEDAPDIPPLIQATYDEETNIWQLSHRNDGTLMFRVDRKVLIAESCMIGRISPSGVRDSFLTYLEEEAGIRGCQAIEFYESVIPLDDIQTPGDYFTARGYVGTASGKWMKRIEQSRQSGELHLAQAA